MTKAQLPLFERMNPSHLINLLEWRGEKDEENPVHVIRPAPKCDDNTERTIISILAVEIAKEKWHYVGVINIDRLLNHQNGKKRTYCERCLKPLFYTKKNITKADVRADHLKSCMMSNPDSAQMTERTHLKFESYGKTQRLPYVMYADTECFLSPDENNDKVTNHTPCAIGLLLVSHPDMKAEPLSIPYTTFTGKDCMLKACEFIEDIAKQVYKWNQVNSYQKVSLSKTEADDHEKRTNCYICNCIFTQDEDTIKVVEHDHLTGKQRNKF